MAKAIGNQMSQFLAHCPHYLFKSITFYCGKEFSNWKRLCNDHNIDIFFTNPGYPRQRGLNEQSNNLLRYDGLAKQMDFNTGYEAVIQSVSNHRNPIPRRSLKYRATIEVLKLRQDSPYLKCSLNGHLHVVQLVRQLLKNRRKPLLFFGSRTI